MQKIPCTIGVTAHNEEANIGRLLQRLLDQQVATAEPRRIIVIASGCSDNTESIVAGYVAREPRVRLLVQERREGKASAINLLLRQPVEQVVVLCSADLLPAVDAVEKLVAPFVDPELGITGGRPVPINDPNTFMGFAAHLLWQLHHEINAGGGFKAGEMIAFRKVFERIPGHTAVDEASIEPIVRSQGYQARYVAGAVVANKGPDTMADFLRQRRRIYAGHLDVTALLGYSVSTMSGATVLKTLLRHLDHRPRQFLWTWGVVALEIYGRYLGWRDYKNKRSHTVWEVSRSTKELEVKM